LDSTLDGITKIRVRFQGVVLDKFHLYDALKRLEYKRERERERGREGEREMMVKGKIRMRSSKA
jgi:hypothetical protein